VSDYRDHLVGAHHTASQDFDKAIMTLSGGALGLSITFVHDIAPHPTNKILLSLAWLLFSISLLLILVSFLSSQAAVLAMIKTLDEPKSPSKKVSAFVTACLNWAAAATLVSGVLCLVLFALYNL
jgi:TRAP-type C4-dicarboxylate transport system permease small subunit